ncbi:endonuclease/exonuclease/phosphatase family protein [Sandarakinorhabdus oryzae]|uniref:endonuclease/exonuclease/phosphatase family protein n=1 Tax=Sandarakinorhabdus oryzae TaxID=2675220 RepID=UPI0012E1731C|nr:endonuclease/exonuclease/phosphatase family protein [Sandarakinorhabdus oryzae]
MRLAAFNVENLFDRARAFDDDNQAVLAAFGRAQALLAQADYSASRQQIIDEFTILGLLKADENRNVILRQSRGSLLSRPQTGPPRIVADGRADWVGSLELKRQPVNHAAMLHTAMVVRDLKADILGVVEAEDRPSLAAFNSEILASSAVGGQAFRHVMLIDGNDDRGIDVGLMTRKTLPIGTMRSRVDDRRANGRVLFSRDCPEFHLETASGPLLIMLCHFKSKFGGNDAASQAKRKDEATRVAGIYKAHRTAGIDRIAIMGDFNDTPDSAPLAPLLAGTDLADIFTLPVHNDGGFPGTHGNCRAGTKIDYILLSPALAAKATASGVIRSGMRPGKTKPPWPIYDTLESTVQSASDHAAIWVDLAI